MAETKPSWPRVTRPLAEYAVGFRDELARLGYTLLTGAGQLRLVARWLAAEGLGASALTAPVLERYFVGRRAAAYVNERLRLQRGFLSDFQLIIWSENRTSARRAFTADGGLCRRLPGVWAQWVSWRCG
jgi:hypothetical protein